MTLVWKPGYSFDSDASTYIDAVETADGQALETGVRVAINDFVLGCKQDEIWDAIKASCILAGARTLAGALIPLAGTAPTKNGTEGGWSYNRKIGLQGNGTDNYLDSNRAGNADPQNDAHLAVYAQSAATSNTAGGDAYIGVGGNGTGAKNIVRRNTGALEMSWRINNATGQEDGTNNATGLIGASRGVSTSITARASGTNYLFTVNSDGTDSNNIHVFQVNWSVLSLTSNPRLTFYSIGESLDLAALDTRVSNLITAIGVAIP